jgi:glycosyltransferase involved in cell wall biosynthesis
MKITIITPHLKIAGGVIILANYAHYLSGLGHEVQVVLVNKISWRRRLANFLRFKPSWARELSLKIKRIPALEEKFLPTADILLFSASQQAKIVENFSKRVGRKFYLVQHDERMYHNNPAEAAYTYNLPYNFLAVSSWLKAMLQKDFGQSADLLLNTVDKNIFCLKKFGRKNKNLRLLLLNHNSPWKGSEEGVEIVSQLKKKYDNIELVMFGAKNKKSIEGIEYHYKIYGKKLAELYNSCDIYLCPSHDEGFGLPSLEAMACGCALVTYDNGGSRDFAFDGQTALVAERKNLHDLKNKLELLIRDENLRNKIIEGGNNFVKNYSGWKEQTKKMENFLIKPKF